MKNKITLSVLFLNMICVFAQEKEFIVNDNLDNLISKASSFQSSLYDGMTDASMSDTKFETDLIVENEEYDSAINDNYLKIKLTTPLSITSNWNLVLQKISSSQTKVSVTLAKAVSNNKVLKMEQTASSGKLEKDLKEYLTSNGKGSKKVTTEAGHNTATSTIATNQETDLQLLKKNNYAVQYPKDWTMQSPGPFNEPFCLFGPKEEEYVYINLIKEENSKPKPGELLQAYMERNLYNIVSKRVLITKKELVNATTYKIEYEEEIDEVLKSIRYIYKVKDDIYLLTYCSTATYFNAYSKQAEAIMKTLKIDGILKNIK
ncbi:hypothetical protein HNQ02_000078 [Flavobacterium sp. 7E]|uniref:hypothetical protein n=1 Tax=Flavobacterium sp. 7E TaxID=2735898 RepID=UPI00156D99DA|nr:hypothetical protein [Flavobacterium sp. 7E]NRS87178.1 hypothetical protein [Flavobacterium sp. 7E]